MGERTVFYTGASRGPVLQWTRTRAPAEQAARASYDRYLERQCQAFLHLVPREGIRPLYARARAWAAERGMHEAKDPMASLLAFCRAHLPLPSFRVWMEDVEAHPGAHAEEISRLPTSEEDRAPSRVAARTIEHGGRRWNVGLNVFHEDGSWRGFLEFHEAPRVGVPVRAHRTATVFCEPRLTTVQEIFEGFRDDTLAGFLRSTLP